MILLLDLSHLQRHSQRAVENSKRRPLPSIASNLTLMMRCIILLHAIPMPMIINLHHPWKTCQNLLGLGTLLDIGLTITIGLVAISSSDLVLIFWCIYPNRLPLNLFLLWPQLIFPMSLPLS